MFRLCFRRCLLVVGGVLLFMAVFPILAVVPLQQPWDTVVMASKLVMLPVGALCLLWAAGLAVAQSRR